MKARFFFIGCLALLLSLSAQETARGQIPQTISYQGVLVDADGNSMDGVFEITFRLYQSDQGGSPLWEEVQQTTVEDGLFNVILGESVPLDLPFDRPYWLGITVGDGAELQPRIPLAAVAYSLNARSVADSSVSTAKIRDGAVTQAKLAPDVTMPPGGAAGGDLTGYYPNPTIAAEAVTATKIKRGQVVKSLNRLKDDVTLAAGNNVSIAASGDTLTISAISSGDGHSLDAADGDPADALYVDARGKVGIGTSEPRGLLSVAFDADNSADAQPVQSLPFGLSLSNLNAAPASYVPLYFIHGQNDFGLDVGAVIRSRLKRIYTGRANSDLEFWTRNGDTPSLSLAMTIENDGRVGIGAADPKALLEVQKTTDNAEIRVTGQDNVAGKGAILSLMEYHPSSDYGFRIWLEGVKNQLHVEGFSGGVSRGKHLTINRDNGNVGIGASDPAERLHVAGRARFDVGSNARIAFGTTSYATAAAAIEGAAADGRVSLIEFTSAGLLLRGGPSTGGLEIDGSGRVGIMTSPSNYLTIGRGRGPGLADGWATYSSRRWKKNIQPIDGALEKVQRLRGVTFEWKKDGKRDIGLIAEEVGEVFPELVEYEENGRDAKSVDYARLVAVLIEAVKAQNRKIDEQGRLIETLQRRIDDLEKSERLTRR